MTVPCVRHSTRIRIDAILFSYNFERNFYRNFLVEFNNCLVSTDFLNILKNDGLAIDFETELSQLFSDMKAIYRTVTAPVRAYLSTR
ncbi:hypothetical protein EVA_07852 [gut metagenome]|uniref:Uncharacterized protein n=1 Tax=gut metagenome TaxID=749906 RepID=J9CV13_9ZZZZ